VDTSQRTLPAKLAVGTAAGVNALTLPGAGGGDTPAGGALSEKNAKRKARREKQERAVAAETQAAKAKGEAAAAKNASKESSKVSKESSKASKAVTVASTAETARDVARQVRREAAAALERQAAALRAEVSSDDDEEEEVAERDWGAQFSSDEDEDEDAALDAALRGSDTEDEEEGEMRDDDDEDTEEKEAADDEEEEIDEEEAPGVSAPPPSKGPGKLSLVDKMRAKLSGGQFRMLNEALYTTTGDRALDMVQDSPGMFAAYHQGFREQTKEWPVRPLDLCVRWLRTQPSTAAVADFGCGDAELARAAPQTTVHSFDLESDAPGVVACNMAQVPLPDASVEVAVFSLSLMGTDYGAFLEEAHRVLKVGGVLWIAEVRSRFDGSAGHASVSSFLAVCAQLGFVLKGKPDESNTMFFIVHLVKGKGAARAGAKVRGKAGATPGSGLKWPKLKACIYKRR